MSPVIGLTGPIGCGKSTVAARLAVHGGHVIDADALARLVTGPGRGTLKAIRERFGDAVFDDRGELDRAALSAVAFDDPGALRDLEAIVHPAVRLEVVARLGSPQAQTAPFIVIEAIRLVEGGLASRCDEIWLVVCDRPTQRDRLRGRGMDPDDAERRIAAQGDMAERLAPAATRILRTDGPLDAVLVSIDAALREALGGAPRNP
jgi:dephospho-CoA kinase